jgi:hypothetical protein
MAARTAIGAACNKSGAIQGFVVVVGTSNGRRVSGRGAVVRACDVTMSHWQCCACARPCPRAPGAQLARPHSRHTSLIQIPNAADRRTPSCPAPPSLYGSRVGYERVSGLARPPDWPAQALATTSSCFPALPHAHRRWQAREAVQNGLLLVLGQRPGRAGARAGQQAHTPAAHHPKQQP